MTASENREAAPNSEAPDLVRCGWTGNSTEYMRYHDEEWGLPLHGDRELFEKLSLEGFQAGLSWLTILLKRPRFREVFANFEPATVASFTETDVERLLTDTGIIRNRQKILATIANATIVRDMHDGEFDTLMWSFAPKTHTRPESLADIPATSTESIALSKELRRRGFKFVGPTTMYALMQSAGMVDDHVPECWRAQEATNAIMS
ncbi:MAG: DNA-3-methyladenine glycosylase I [Gulosibacter sp.]|uniref:DNA-3-methyladenine glycosylase I n=1 Tax=Gulosibacter sp. TaxID=2817531 RepID=UPI003F8DAC7F